MTTTNGGHAEGLIEVKSYVPTTFDEAVEGPKLVEINVTETFTGQIRGEGRVRFVQAARSDGSASYVGIERVVGTLAGRKGSFLLQDSGTVVGEDVAGEWWFVIPRPGS